MLMVEDNIKNELTEIELEDMDWIRLAYDNDRVWVFAYTVMSFLVLKKQ
jgi:hypothetical protein